MNDKPLPIYRMGAENGLVLGPLMAVTVLCMGATTYMPMMFLPTLLMMVVVPAAACYMLARSYRQYPVQMTFSALWLQGICAFFFGGLILSAVAYIAMRWVWPSFIDDQVRMVVDIYGSVSDEQARSLARSLQQIADSGALPTPIDVALELLYCVVFTGSLLSMVLSFVIRRMPRRQQPPVFPNN